MYMVVDKVKYFAVFQLKYAQCSRHQKNHSKMHRINISQSIESKPLQLNEKKITQVTEVEVDVGIHSSVVDKFIWNVLIREKIKRNSRIFSCYLRLNFYSSSNISTTVACESFN